MYQNVKEQKYVYDNVGALPGIWYKRDRNSVER